MLNKFWTRSLISGPEHADLLSKLFSFAITSKTNKFVSENFMFNISPYPVSSKIVKNYLDIGAKDWRLEVEN